MTNHILTTCRACGSRYVDCVLYLGYQEPSNALALSAEQPQRQYPLELYVCKSCWLLQTGYDVPHYELFNKDYPYFSGVIPGWKRHCQQYVRAITARENLGYHSTVVEVGGNDGTLLEQFDLPRVNLLNVEPSHSVAQVCREKGINVTETPWEYMKLYHRADLIIANNVMAHTPNLPGFVASIARNLANDGVATIEFPWAKNMIDAGLFDTIYHEHYSYFTITALRKLFKHYGLQITMVDRLEAIHGGSLRIYVRHGTAPSPFSYYVDAVEASEAPLRDPKTYEQFAEGVATNIGDFKAFLRQKRGMVLGYGAAAKGAVYLAAAGVTSEELPFVADITPAKQGKFLPTTRIPVVAEEVLVDVRPDFVLVLAWNWREEIIRRLRGKLPNATFVTAMPRLVFSRPQYHVETHVHP